jgi:hypothetical protein
LSTTEWKIIVCQNWLDGSTDKERNASLPR